MHSAQGPQALDDNQPNLSHKFSTAWKIHRTIWQTWNGLLHCLEFHCCPHTTSLDVTELRLLGELSAKTPFIICSSPPFSSAYLKRTCSSCCTLITGTCNSDKSNTSHSRQLSLMVWKTAVLMKISWNQREVTEYQAVWSVRLNVKQVQILLLFTLKTVWCVIALSNQTSSTDLFLIYLSLSCTGINVAKVIVITPVQSKNSKACRYS